MPKHLPSLISKAPPRLAQPPKIAESFYTSPEWRSLAAAIKRERGYMCQRCGSRHRVIADHIKERKDGGAPLDRANIELLCASCHNGKTARAAKARTRGQL